MLSGRSAERGAGGRPGEEGAEAETWGGGGRGGGLQVPKGGREGGEVGQMPVSG